MHNRVPKEVNKFPRSKTKQQEKNMQIIKKKQQTKKGSYTLEW